MLIGPIYNIGSEFVSNDVNIARACKGFIISEDTK